MVPIHLELRNFFSHKRSEIDFAQFDAALLIGNTEGDYDLSNGSGKSAIFESILWCLFNKARVAAMDDIILWGEEGCAVSITFVQDDVWYKVRRTRSRVTGTSAVEFAYLSEDDDWIDISGSTAKLTNEKIVGIIKFDYKTFVNSAYFRQNDISEFAESEAGRKKEILKSIIDLSKWDSYEKEAKARLKGIKSETSILQSKIAELDVDEVELAKVNGRLDTLQVELTDLSKQRTQNGEALEKMISRYQKIKNNLDTDQWDKIVAENKDLDQKIVRFKKKKESTESTVNVVKNKINPIKNQISELEEIVSEITIDKDIDEKIKKVRDSLVTYRTKLSTANHLVTILNKKNIADEICDVCGQEVSEEVHSGLVHTHNEAKKEYDKEIVFASNKIEESNGLLKKYSAIQKDNKKAESFTGKLKTLRVQLEMLQGQLLSKKGELTTIEGDLQGFISRRENNTSVLDSLKNDDFQELHVEIETMRARKTSLEGLIAEKNREIGVLSEKTKTLAASIEKMKLDKASLLKMTKKQAAYEKAAKLLGKNGIQTILLNAVIEDLEKTANQILLSICNEPLGILLETQRLGSDGVSLVDTLDLKVKKDGITQNFKSLSGGEQFRISLSLRIALSEISSRHGGSSLEFLLLDEINSPLDRHGTENLFVNVVKSLEKKYKIMVITHNDSLKEKFLNVIDVTKINGESTTLFTQK